MLTITIPSTEMYDERNNEFLYTKEQKLTLEHSLISISKWEAKWRKAFLSGKEKTYEETIDYIRCMTINSNVDSSVYSGITDDNIAEVNSYINAPMTATVINDTRKGKSNDVVTSELIYYWMISLNIPVEFQKWHLNRLLTLIRVCNFKNYSGKRMSNRELMSRNRAINESRKAKLHTRG